MKKTVSMLLALLLLSAPALGERYDSPFGYSMELPEGWLPLNADTYSQIAATLGEEKLREMGLPEDMVAAMAQAGMEYLFSGDGGANAAVTVVRQAVTPEELALTAEIARLGYEQAGATDVVDGTARFGENEFQAVACKLMGIVVAHYFCASGEMLYSTVFSNASAEDVSTMLSSAAFSPAASPEETAPADGVGPADGAGPADGVGPAEETAPAGAVFTMNGALKEPRW